MNALSRKIAVVTGGNSGIGKEAAIGIAREGAHVVIAARNPAKAAAARTEIETRADARGRVETIPIDLASFASVRAFADAFAAEHDRLDILLNNAGGVLRKRVVTVDGHEMQFQVNHLGHFLLTNLLHDALARGAPARVVNVSSFAHTTARNGLDFDDLDWERRRYGGFGVYSATKLMNLLFTRELARRSDPDVLTANALHPGFVASNFAREGDLGLLGSVGMPLIRPFAISSQKGALISIYLASSPDVEGITGQYFIKGKAVKPAAPALDDAAAARLWEISEKLTVG
ncbi:MAG: SDR family oxidoreductase [Actinomycetota bacterium]|nr:SDR family oxidoreductase [Actinomycetota bacterium]